MNIRLLDPAQLELDEAVAWYSAQAPRLGEAFLLEAVKAFQRIEQHPLAWHPLGKQIRRYRLSRFPYGVIYTVADGDLLVLAITHLHRRPHYWRDRLTGDQS